MEKSFLYVKVAGWEKGPGKDKKDRSHKNEDGDKAVKDQPTYFGKKEEDLEQEIRPFIGPLRPSVSLSFSNIGSESFVSSLET